MVFAVVDVCGRTLCMTLSSQCFDESPTIVDIKVEVCRRIGLPIEDQYVLVGGRMTCDESPIVSDCMVQVRVRGSGGKGGFGSLLKGAATAYGFGESNRRNFGACRDLQGRRVRHVENDLKLRTWDTQERFTREKELKERIDQRKKRKYEQLAPPAPPKPVQKDTPTPQEMEMKLDAVRSSVHESVQHALKKTRKSHKEDDDDILPLDHDSSESTPQSQQHRSSSSPHPTSSSSSSSSAPVHSPPSTTATTASSSAIAGSEQHDATTTPTITSSSSSSAPQDKFSLDLNQFSSAQELEAIGMEELKTELHQRGLKCGGGLTERAARLFSVRGLAPHEYPPKSLAK